MKNYSKKFKYIMLGLMAVSIIILAIGWIVGFETGNGGATDALLIWAYVMVALSVLAIAGIGGYIRYKSNPGSLKKMGVVLGAIAVLVVLVYLISPGDPGVGLYEQPSHQTLKMTDLILNLSFIAGVGAIAAIIGGEIYRRVQDKKELK